MTFAGPALPGVLVQRTGRQTQIEEINSRKKREVSPVFVKLVRSHEELADCAAQEGGRCNRPAQEFLQIPVRIILHPAKSHDHDRNCLWTSIGQKDLHTNRFDLMAEVRGALFRYWARLTSGCRFRHSSKRPDLLNQHPMDKWFSNKRKTIAALEFYNTIAVPGHEKDFCL